MDRALIVDVLPLDEQELANAWAGRMIGVGHVMGFFM
jgi:solute carrier family 45 protein 1/2/4